MIEWPLPFLAARVPVSPIGWAAVVLGTVFALLAALQCDGVFTASPGVRGPLWWALAAPLWLFDLIWVAIVTIGGISMSNRGDNGL